MTIRKNLLYHFNERFKTVFSKENTQTVTDFYLVNNEFTIPKIPAFLPIHGMSINKIPATAYPISSIFELNENQDYEITIRIVGENKKEGTVNVIEFDIMNLEKAFATKIIFQTKVTENESHNSVANKIKQIIYNRTNTSECRWFSDADSEAKTNFVNLFLGSLFISVVDDTLHIIAGKHFVEQNQNFLKCTISVSFSAPKKMIWLNRRYNMVYPENQDLFSGYFTNSSEENKELLNNHIISLGTQPVLDLQSTYIPPVPSEEELSVMLYKSKIIRGAMWSTGASVYFTMFFSYLDNRKQYLNIVNDFLSKLDKVTLNNYSLIVASITPGSNKLLVLYGINEINITDTTKNGKEGISITLHPKAYNRQVDAVGYIKESNDKVWFE